MVSLSAAAAEYRAANPAEVKAAVRAAKPGDAIVLKDGPWRDADILFDAEGTAEKPITLRAETPGKVVFSGKSQLRIGGRHLVVDGLLFQNGTLDGDVIAFRANSRQWAQHCRLTNCAVVDYSPADKKVDSKWVSLYGAHNRVDHCFLQGKTNAGATLVVWLSDEPNEHQIDHNHFGRRAPLGVNGGETIRVGTSEWSLQSSRTIVEHNYFQECSGEIEIISSKSCDNVYRYNTFVDCEGALTLRHGNRCVVDGNIFLGHGKRSTGGVRIIGEEHQVINNYFEGLAGDGARSAISLMNGIPNSPLNGYFQVKRAVVAFNTCVDSKATLTIGLVGSNPAGGVLAPEDCTFANNIFRGKETLILQSTNPTGAIWQGNLLFGGEPGVPLAAGLSVKDPLLERGKDGLLRPAASSPAIGAAVGDFDWLRKDFDGQSRGDQRDVGCDQVSTERVPQRVLTAADVGPAWLDAAKRGLIAK
jgi:poly(beta-D-mannuronate) lyase